MSTLWTVVWIGGRELDVGDVGVVDLVEAEGGDLLRWTLFGLIRHMFHLFTLIVLTSIIKYLDDF